MNKKVVKGLGIVLILVSMIILLTMNSFIIPFIEDGAIDTGEYYIKIIINGIRFIVLSITFSVIGIKMLFKD